MRTWRLASLEPWEEQIALEPLHIEHGDVFEEREICLARKGDRNFSLQAAGLANINRVRVKWVISSPKITDMDLGTGTGYPVAT